MGNTNVCNKNESLWYDKQAVPLNYRMFREDGACALPFIATNTSFKGALQYEVSLCIFIVISRAGFIVSFMSVTKPQFLNFWKSNIRLQKWKIVVSEN